MQDYIKTMPSPPKKKPNQTRTLGLTGHKYIGEYALSTVIHYSVSVIQLQSKRPASSLSSKTDQHVSKMEINVFFSSAFLIFFFQSKPNATVCLHM